MGEGALGLFPELEDEPIMEHYYSTSEDEAVELEKVSSSDDSLPNLHAAIVDESFLASIEILTSPLDNNKMAETFDKDVIQSLDKTPELLTNPSSRDNKRLRSTSRKTAGKFLPDLETDVKSSRNSLSKNALAARQNRIKKKKYVEELESSTNNMKTAIRELEKENKDKNLMIDKLTEENKYLKGVLANMPGISALLKSVKNTPGLKFSGSSLTSEMKSKRKRNSSCSSEICEGESEELKRRRMNDGEDPAGICLHVSGEFLSLEFCPTCSSRASSNVGSSIKETDDEES